MKNTTIGTKSGHSIQAESSVSNIRRDEWLAALNEAWVRGVTNNPEALTRKEIAAILSVNFGSKGFSDTLNKLIKQEDVILIRKAIQKSNGKRGSVPAYVLTDKCKKRLKMR